MIINPRSWFSCGIILLSLSVLTGCSREAKRNRYLGEGAKDFQTGAYDKARIDYLKVLQIDPSNATALARLGQIWLDDGAPLQAGAPLKKAADLAPTDSQNRLRLARVYFAVGQTAEARREVLAVLQQSPAMGDALVFLTEIVRTSEEISAAELAIAQFPNRMAESYQLAVANLALRKNDLPAAEESIKQAIALAPKSPQAHQAMGILHLLQKNQKSAAEEFKTAAGLAPLRSNIRTAYAEYIRQTESGEGARSFLSSLTAQAPDFLPAWTLLGRIAFSEKKFDQALSYLENVFSRDPENIDARLLQSDVWLAQGEINKAITELAKLDKAFPSLPLAKYRLARAYLQDNKTSQAAAVLDQALAANPNYTEAILLRAELNIRTGQGRTAIRTLEELLKKNAGLKSAQFLLADAYRAAGRFDDAVNIFQEQIKVTPNAPEPYFLRGLTELQQNKTEEARKSFEKVLELSPDNVLALEQLVNVDLGAKDFAGATQRVEEQLKKHPDRATSYILEGRVRLAQEEWKEAELALHKAIELNPNSAPAYEMLVKSYLATNKLPEAVRELETVLAKAPQNQSALMTLATVREKQNDYPEARATYEKLLTHNPNFVPALNNLSYLYAEYLNQPNKAYELAQKARALDPGNVAVADTLGWAAYKRGDYPQALTLLEEVAGKLGTSPEIQYHLGMIYYMMGQADAARVALQKATATPDDFPGKNEAQRRLSFLNQTAGSPSAPTAAQLEEMLKQDPNDVLVQFRLGEVYEKQKAFDRAVAAYEAALTSNPKLASAALRLAQLYSGPLHNGQKALEFAKNARDLAPLDPRITGLLGRIALDNGKVAWAYSLLRENVHQLPDDPTFLHDFAQAAYELGKIGQAQSAMQKLVDLNPNGPQASDAKKFLAMAALESQPQAAVAAEAEINRILADEPAYVPALIARAVAQSQRDQIQAAIETLRRILRDSPDCALAQKHLAALYLRDPDQVDSAYELATKAHEVLTDDPELSEILGEISYRKKEYARAIQLLQEGARGEPLDAKALFYLGMSQLQAKLEAEGRQTLEKALAAALEEPLAAEARQALEALPKQDRSVQP